MKAVYRREIRKLYNPLKEKIGVKNSSVFLKLITKRKNKIRDFVSNAGITSTLIDQRLCKELEEKGFIVKHPNDFHRYCLTASGLWNYEKSRENVDLESLLKEFDSEYFRTTTNPISDTGKIILFSLLCNRNFSNDCTITMETDTINSHYNIVWLNFTILVKDTLLKAKIISEKGKYSFATNNNKTYLMQRDNYLVEQTNGIYQRLNNVHYLDMTDKQGNIRERNLQSLFNLIITENFKSVEQIEIIKNAIKTFARNERHKISPDQSYLDIKTTKSIIKAFDEEFL
jgi:hypothetical protein|tara:strand:- start:35 stop:892 length:858 start_codon:yes stop_codon:yes gene_type:complete